LESSVRAILTEAYSPRNLGDAELVRRSAECAHTWGYDAVDCLATDIEGFSAVRELDRIAPRILSRAEWHSRRRVSRFIWLGAEIISMTALVIIASTFKDSNKRRESCRNVSRLLRRKWSIVFEADVLLPVGGGYLGDAYAKETVIALLQYWILGRCGTPVVTMPISIASLDSKVLRRAVRATSKGVIWHAREEYTLHLLDSIGASVRLVPDLAWLNARRTATRTGTGSVAIAPVGRFYALPQDDLVSRLGMILDDPQFDHEKISIVAMHRSGGSTLDGGDEKAGESLMKRVRPGQVFSRVNASSYSELLDFLEGVDLLLTGRLHAAIASACVGLPASVVAYEPKHAGVLRLAGLSAFLESPSKLGSAEITSAALRQRDMVLDFFARGLPR
jgi:polysaccharide pyruvyl transferase WcaK-like protein